MSADYRGDTYSLSATVGNPDILNNSGIYYAFIYCILLLVNSKTQN